MTNNDIISIAVDGPAGAGKSTIAKKVAEELSITYIDTGAMYRAITYKLINEEVDLSDESSIEKILKDTDINFKNNNIILDGFNINNEIRNNYISKNVSNVAKLKIVRDSMLEIQRNLAKEESVIMDGRDIGSVVLPNASFKFFITADVSIRAQRRYDELLKMGEKGINLEDIEKEIIERDRIDSNREIAPLIESEDSFRIDNSYKTIDESVKDIVNIVKRGKNAL